MFSINFDGFNKSGWKVNPGSGNTQASWEGFSPSKTPNSSPPSVFVMDNSIGLVESTVQTQPPLAFKPDHNLKALSGEILEPP